jgi:hypothetical protein
MFEKKVFISHSSKNKEIADAISVYLTQIGVKNENIFCSSIVSQGVRNGESLNSAIARAIKQSSLLIFLISYDFVNSNYCIEELGVGWYLSHLKKASSYYIILPDIDLSYLGGFVNPSVDKLSFLDNAHKDDLSLLSDDVFSCLSLKAKGHKQISHAENVLFSSTRTLLDQLVEEKTTRQSDISRYKEKIHTLETSLDEEIKKNSAAELQRALLLQFSKIESEQAQMQKERDTLADLFWRFGVLSGVSREVFTSLPKGFWFDAIHRYIDLDKQVRYHDDNDCMEKFIATAFLHEGNMTEAYNHLKAFVLLHESRIDIYDLEYFLSYYPHSLSEILTLVEDAIPLEKEGDRRDSLLLVRDTLKKREQAL